MTSHRTRWRWALGAALALVTSLSGRAASARDANFDYYVFSLSWSPQYCAERRHEDAPQCARDYAFVAHGLWPQYAHGVPRDCDTRERVDEATIARLLPIMPSRGLIIHEWRMHGACSGLSPERYFAQVERAWHSLRIPARYGQAVDTLRVDAGAFKRALSEDNPGLSADGIVLRCTGRYLQEVRICLDATLAPRACAVDLRDRCGDAFVLRPRR